GARPGSASLALAYVPRVPLTSGMLLDSLAVPGAVFAQTSEEARPPHAFKPITVRTEIAASQRPPRRGAHGPTVGFEFHHPSRSVEGRRRCGCRRTRGRRGPSRSRVRRRPDAEAGWDATALGHH